MGYALPIPTFVYAATCIFSLTAINGETIDAFVEALKREFSFAEISELP
jgi:hypothetical protein